MKIDLVRNPSEAEIAIIYQGLHEFNISHFPELIEHAFGLFVRGENNEIVGGAIGIILPSVMQIKYLWLVENMRGQGIGKKLMRRLEIEAYERNLESIVLESYTFQAPTFYTKLGFIEVGRYVNCPWIGINKIFFQKNIRGLKILGNYSLDRV